MVQIASFVEPEFYFTGRYYNLAFVMTNVMVFFRGSNSSFNFYINYVDDGAEYEQPGTVRPYATFSNCACGRRVNQGRSPKRVETINK